MRSGRTRPKSAALSARPSGGRTGRTAIISDRSGSSSCKSAGRRSISDRVAKSKNEAVASRRSGGTNKSRRHHQPRLISWTEERFNLMMAELDLESRSKQELEQDKDQQCNTRARSARCCSCRDRRSARAGEDTPTLRLRLERRVNEPGKTAESAERPPDPNLHESPSKIRLREQAAHRQMTALLDGSKVAPSDMVKSEEERPVPRHFQHGWNFYREKHKNAWNNLWSVPPSRLKFVASKASNDYAIKCIDESFESAYSCEMERMKKQKVVHDCILSRFRVRCLKNVARQRRIQTDWKNMMLRDSDPMPSRQQSSETFQRQQKTCALLSRPRTRRNQPELAAGAYDMPEYRGLIVQADFFSEPSSSAQQQHWACVRAKQIYEGLLCRRRQQQQQTERQQTEVVSAAATTVSKPRRPSSAPAAAASRRTARPTATTPVEGSRYTIAELSAFEQRLAAQYSSSSSS